MRAVTWRKAIFPLLASVLALSLAFTAMSLPPAPAAAQELVELWHAVYDGGGEDRAYDVAVDSQGNIIVTGCSNVSGYNQYYTIKYDPDGNELWNDTWGYGTNSGAFGVAVDSEDNIIVIGSCIVEEYARYGAIKYAPNGTQLWIRTGGYSGSHFEGRDVAVDSDDNIAVIVYDHGVFDNFTWNDYRTYKWDPDGVGLWSQLYDGGAYDEPWGIAVDSNYNVIVTGTSYHVDGDHPCTIKYNETGSLLSGWPVFYDGGVGAYAVATDPDDNIIITGYNMTLDFLPVTNYCTVKYDANGTELWNATYDSGDDDVAHGVATDSEGNIVVTGWSFVNAGDYYTIKYDPDGNELWSKSYDGGSADVAWGVAVDAEGNIIVTGYSWNATGTDTDDYYTIKYGIAPAPPAEEGLSAGAIAGIAVGGAAAAAGIYFFVIRRWLKPGRVE